MFNKAKILELNECTHTEDNVQHSPNLSGCECIWIQGIVNDYTNSSIGKVKQAVEMLGLPEKQERATKKAISDIIWKNVEAINEHMWACTPEGSKCIEMIGEDPEPQGLSEE